MREWGSRGRAGASPTRGVVVWSVESTRCPVKAACTACSAVSGRGSRDHDESGSGAARAQRGANGEGLAICGRPPPVEVLEDHFDGLLDGDDVDLGLESASHRVRGVVVLPCRWGRCEDAPVGPRMKSYNVADPARRVPVVDPLERSGSRCAARPSRRTRWAGDTRSSISRPPARACCGRPRAALLGQFRPREQLVSRKPPLVDDPRDEVDVVQDAVDASAPGSGSAGLKWMSDARSRSLVGWWADRLHHRRRRGSSSLFSPDREPWFRGPRRDAASG